MKNRRLVSTTINGTNFFNFNENEIQDLIFVTDKGEVNYNDISIMGVVTFNQIKNMLSSKYPSYIKEVYVLEKNEENKNKFFKNNEEKYKKAIKALYEGYEATLKNFYNTAYMTYAPFHKVELLIKIRDFKTHGLSEKKLKKAFFDLENEVKETEYNIKFQDDRVIADKYYD